jgi:hypothetical protein
LLGGAWRMHRFRWCLVTAAVVAGSTAVGGLEGSAVVVVRGLLCSAMPRSNALASDSDCTRSMLAAAPAAPSAARAPPTARRPGASAASVDSTRSRCVGSSTSCSTGPCVPTSSSSEGLASSIDSAKTSSTASCASPESAEKNCASPGPAAELLLSPTSGSTASMAPGSTSSAPEWNGDPMPILRSSLFFFERGRSRSLCVWRPQPPQWPPPLGPLLLTWQFSLLFSQRWWRLGHLPFSRRPSSARRFALARLAFFRVATPTVRACVCVSGRLASSLCSIAATSRT